jgi:hypothetical protein
MKNIGQIFMGMTLMFISCLPSLPAQDSYEKLNSSLGVAVSTPLNPTSQFVRTGWGAVAGAGYNFNSRHSVIGEFMWSRFYGTASGLQPLSAISSSSISGNSNVYSLTGNYRFELAGKVFRPYFIGGGGLYYRVASLSKPLTSGTNTSCTPSWVWWGFNCTSGIVTANQTITSESSNAFGVNGGVGFTMRVGEPPYRMYVESRYHYAPNRNISTQFLMVAVGIRY